MQNVIAAQNKGGYMAINTTFSNYSYNVRIHRIIDSWHAAMQQDLAAAKQAMACLSELGATKCLEMASAY